MRTPPRRATSKKATVGQKLYDARQRRGYTREFATAAANEHLPSSKQFVPTTLTRIESGKIAHTDSAAVAALVRVYRMQLKDIDIDLRDEAAQLADLFTKACAPWESNPEPADSRHDMARAS